MASQQSVPLDYAVPMTPPGRRRGGIFGWIVFIGLAIVLFLALRQNSGPPSAAVSLDRFFSQLHGGTVTHITLAGDRVLYQTQGSPVGVTRTFHTDLPTGMGGQWSFVHSILDDAGGATVEVDHHQDLLINLLLPLVPWLLIFGFVWFFVVRRLRAVKPAVPIASGREVGQ